MMQRLNSNRFSVKLACVIMSVVMVMAIMPTGLFSASAVTGGELNVATISDTHYFAKGDMGDFGDGFTEVTLASSELLLQGGGLLDSALQAAVQDGAEYVLMPGDLSFNGEYNAHAELAAKLEAFEEETGIQVCVTNGNHDINNDQAAKYVLDEATGEYYWDVADTVTPEQFREIYSNLGYDIAYHTYTPAFGKAGALSYSVKLNDAYRLIVIDAGKYSADATASGLDRWETGGNITPELMDWILAEIADAEKDGAVPIAMTHWNLSPQSYFQANTLQGFVMDDYEDAASTLADAGLHYVFTGHSHSMDVSSLTTDDGEVIYSIMTSALCAFPNMFRETTFTTGTDGVTSFTTNGVDADKYIPVVDVTGTEYSQPFREAGFDIEFFGADPLDYAMGLLGGRLEDILKEISDAGLISYIEAKVGIDIENTIDELLHGGLMINNQNIVTAKNFMGILKDLEKQISVRYIDNPEHTLELVEGLIDSFMSIEMSELPCSKFYSEYGIGSRRGAGTLGDVLMSAFVYMYGGNEDISDDAFMLDVLDGFKSGENVQKIIDWALENVVQNVLIEDFLKNIDLHLSSFVIDETSAEIKAFFEMLDKDTLKELIERFVDIDPVLDQLQEILVNLDGITVMFGIGEISGYLGMLEAIDIKGVISALLTDKGVNVDPSLYGIANLVLGYDVVDWGKSIEEVLDYALSHYVTDEQVEGIGYQCWLLLSSVVTDSVPQTVGDFDVTYTYSGPITVVPTIEDYRLPTIVASSFGSDSSTEFNLSWYSKKTLTSTDIELIEGDGGDAVPSFTGTPTVAENISASSEEIARTFYGVDIGVAGILPATVNLLHHKVSITALKPGTTYYYRIGNAARGWWSDTGSFTTAAGDESAFTFFHMTDSQSQSPEQYSRTWGNVVNTAYTMFPDASFILHTGDVVDNGDNLKQWQWCLDSAAKQIMNSAIMPVSGNHEAFGSYATFDNFNLDIQDETQDPETGVYYSFDYNNAHFAILNTNTLNDDGTINDAQLAWLKADLAASEAEWKIVALHKAVYSNGDHYKDDDVVALRAQLAVLMPELDVDLVLQGHDHVYLRTDALNNNKVISCDKDILMKDGLVVDAMVSPDGTVYAISGAAGVKSYGTVDETLTDEYFPRADRTYSTDLPVFSMIRIEGDTLLFKAYTVNAEGASNEIDSFGIVKYGRYIKLGDVDFSGRVNASDARDVLRHTAGLESLRGEALDAADANLNGKITAADARIILRVAAGLEEFEKEYIQVTVR